jgi:hypothetical protein
VLPHEVEDVVPHRGGFATSSELSLILLMQIKIVVCECNLGCHLTYHQGAAGAHQGNATDIQGIAGAR